MATEGRSQSPACTCRWPARNDGHEAGCPYAEGRSRTITVDLADLRLALRDMRAQDDEANYAFTRLAEAVAHSLGRRAPWEPTADASSQAACRHPSSPCCLHGTGDPEPLTLRTWCGRYTPHGEHDGCLGWGDGRVGVEPDPEAATGPYEEKDGGTRG